jgi:hypothetical protein
MSSWKKIGSYSRGKNNEIVRATTTNITKNIIFQPNNLLPKETGVSFSDNTFQYTAAFNLWEQGDPSSNIYYDKGAVSINTDKQVITDEFSIKSDISNSDLYFGQVISLNNSGDSFVVSYEDTSNNGIVETYKYDENNSEYLSVSKLTNPNNIISATFGKSISINEKENMLAVGDPGDNYSNGGTTTQYIGKVFLYALDTTDINNYWNNNPYVISMESSDNSIDTQSFGSCVSLSSFNDNWVLSVSDIIAGSVFVYINTPMTYYSVPNSNSNFKSINYNENIFFFKGGETASASKFGFDNKIKYIDNNTIHLLISAPWRNIIENETTYDNAGEINFSEFKLNENENEWTLTNTEVQSQKPFTGENFGYSLDWFPNPCYFIVGSPALLNENADSFSNTQLFSICPINGITCTNDICEIGSINSNNSIDSTFGYSVNTTLLIDKIDDPNDDPNDNDNLSFVIGDPTKNLVFLYQYNKIIDSFNQKQIITGSTNDISFGKCVSVSNSFQGENLDSLLLVGYNKKIINQDNETIETGNLGIYQGFSEYNFNVEGNSYFDGNVKITNNVHVDNTLFANDVYSNNIIPNNLGETIVIHGDTEVDGTTSSKIKSFKIDHPNNKKASLIHYSVESPQMDLLYSGETSLINGKAIIDIDNKFSMSNGTFHALNKDIKVFTSNETGWDPVKGFINSEKNLEIICKNENSEDTISYLLIGTRQDKDALKHLKKHRGKFKTEISK